MKIDSIKTLGDLKKSGYKPRSIKEELRENLIDKLQKGEKVFEGILGFDDTVLPDIERAILSRHNILLLGLRGQAKTRIARLDKTPIAWVSSADRYVEKLATPDVSIADLIGDVDPIKAATLKLPYSDERVIHFGLVPRAHRSIFVINELPDLQARIQVSLFNMLQEGDLQIRGFKLRLPLDIQFLFTANPEDYTNRGSIITPLKDRIQSQILTHYPKSIEISRDITSQEAKLHDKQQKSVDLMELHRDLVEIIAFAARESEYIDEKSGVSARLSISAMENLVSTAERRMLINNDTQTYTRLADFWGIIPAITGKVELVYEGEQEGAYNVALHIISSAIKSLFLNYFPAPDSYEKGNEKDPYGTIKAWFSGGNELDLLQDASDKDYMNALDSVAGLRKLVESYKYESRYTYPLMELALHGLSELEVLSKRFLLNNIQFSDPFGDMFDGISEN